MYIDTQFLSISLHNHCVESATDITYKGCKMFHQSGVYFLVFFKKKYSNTNVIVALNLFSSFF